VERDGAREDREGAAQESEEGEGRKRLKEREGGRQGDEQWREKIEEGRGTEIEE
jgi:hypothetical protein